MKQFTLGSLFDGIGGFPYAASFYNIRPLWASEIVPNCISVTRRHFPRWNTWGILPAYRVVTSRQWTLFPLALPAKDCLLPGIAWGWRTPGAACLLKPSEL